MNKKTIAIVVVIILVAVIGVFIGYKFLNKSDEPVKLETFGFTTEEMVCNVKNSRKMVVLQVSIESTDADIIENIAGKEYILTDLTNQIVRDTEEEELHGKEGQNKLQDRIKEKAKEMYDTDTITDIYFKKFAIQN